MIPLRYDLTRWAIAVITLVLIIVLALLQPRGGALVLSVLLVLGSAAAIVLPTGLWLWLLKPTCPDCKGRVEWRAVQEVKNPYHEKLVRRCPECDKETVEISYDPT